MIRAQRKKRRKAEQVTGGQDWVQKENLGLLSFRVRLEETRDLYSER